jgi:hypothetical protein
LGVRSVAGVWVVEYVFFVVFSVSASMREIGKC